MEGAVEDNGIIFAERNQLHPLLIPPVLEVLFSKLSVQDLKACRLVCKDWNMESLSSWRTNATIKFQVNEIVRKRRCFTDPYFSLVEFLDFWENNCAPKPSQFHISMWTFQVDVNAKIARFLALTGEHVTSLTLNRCTFRDRAAFRKIIFQTFPNLQFLKIENCKYEWRGSYDWNTQTEEIPAYEEPTFGVHGLKSLHLDECIPNSMMEILSHFHMLNSLHFDANSFSREKNRILLNTIKVIREQDQKKLPIKHLYVGDDFSEIEWEAARKEEAGTLEDLNLLRQFNIPLHRLSISSFTLAECESKHVEIIKDILLHHSSNLKYLQYFEYFYMTGYYTEAICTQFPFGLQLENLEVVRISDKFCDNLNWLKYTPNLRSLWIHVMKDSDDIDEKNITLSDNLFSNTSKLEIENWALPSLKYFDFDLPISAANMRKLIKWIPNVVEVRLPLDDETFSILCGNWKQLESLSDNGTKLTDEGVTGIGMDEDHEAGCGETRIKCNITQLKSLTFFKTSSCELTARSLHNGFLKMPNLKHYRIPSECRLKIDKEMRAALKKTRDPDHNI